MHLDIGVLIIALLIVWSAITLLAVACVMVSARADRDWERIVHKDDGQ